MRLRLAIAATFCALAVALPAQRLPRTAVPDHYEIHLAPDFATDTFQGQVSIRLRLTQPSDRFVLNAADLEFHETTIITAKGRQAASVALDAPRETATLTVPAAIPAGEATIAIRYSGVLNDKLRGFYLSRANDRKYAITQLEPTDARRAFPSFDEPALKATFAISATIDQRDTAISNNRVVSDTPGPGPGKHTVAFATTKKMSTYVVALLIGDWACVSGGVDGVPIRICGTPNRKSELGFALEATQVTLRYFNSYFAIKYPFEKLDIIAVPDFAAGAMENTGAIVFREELLFVNDNSSPDQRKRVTEVIGHEVAHQWFGDLVTMAWWNDIWLNEGFATWMELRPAAEWKPEWNARLEEVRDTQSAMSLDALRATRPIRTQVEAPNEILQVFDAIAYEKTAAVIRMVEGFVGAPAYRNATNAYLKRFAYANATGEDFWTTVASSTGKPVDRILSSYITQSSMPLVEVRASCAGSTTTLSLAQKPISNAVPASTTWEIPVCYKRARNGRTLEAACALLSEPSQTVKLEGCSSWLFANVDSRGYYRTSYGSDGLKGLTEAIRTNQLSAVEQASLLEDVWALVRLNQANVADFLSLAANLGAASSPSIPTDRITFISARLVDEAQRPAFERWVRETFGPMAAQLGWDPSPQETDERRSLRSAVLYTLGYAGRDPGVLREARRRTEMHLDGARHLDPSLVNTALQLAALEGDPALYDRYMKLLGGPSQIDQRGYRNALPYFTDPALQKRTLELAMSPAVRSQDAPYLISSMMALPSSAPATWDHIKEHWPALEQSLDLFQGLPQVVLGTQHFCDQPHRDDVSTFMEAHAISGIERATSRALETIDHCIETRSQQSKNLSEFLNRTN